MISLATAMDDAPFGMRKLTSLTGIARPTLYKYKKGLTKPKIANAQKIADALAVRLEEVVEFDLAVEERDNPFPQYKAWYHCVNCGKDMFTSDRAMVASKRYCHEECKDEYKREHARGNR